MNNGWIKAHRKLLDWEWYKRPHMLHLFLYLLLKANHKPGRWQGVEINRGQLITGRKSIMSETGLTSQSVRSCLKLLKSTNEITIKSTNKFSVITICNYDVYQDEFCLINQQTNQPASQQSTSNQPATNQQSTTNKNKKNIRTKEECIAIKERLFSIYKRPKDSEFSKQEEYALSRIKIITEEQLNVLERYYTASIPPEKDYRRRSLINLLKNWNCEMDRANAWIPDIQELKVKYD